MPSNVSAVRVGLAHYLHKNFLAFVPPRHPAGMWALLQHSLDNYGPLPPELRRIRSRTQSCPSPYTQTCSVAASFLQTKVNPRSAIASWRPKHPSIRQQPPYNRCPSIWISSHPFLQYPHLVRSSQTRHFSGRMTQSWQSLGFLLLDHEFLPTQGARLLDGLNVALEKVTTRRTLPRGW